MLRSFRILRIEFEETFGGRPRSCDEERAEDYVADGYTVQSTVVTPDGRFAVVTFVKGEEKPQ